MTRVLITGATGLLGGELMLALARQGVRSTGVVRAPDASAARGRLLDRLGKSERWDPAFADLVEARAGDVVLPGFGLPASVIDEADVLIHSAANTSFKPGAGVYPVNVKAAEQYAGILRTLRPAQRAFFVGTAAVTTAPRGVITEDMPFAGYANDYIRSKRDAETLLRATGVPFVSLRPGIVLARGISDPKLARNMLWSIPVMAELGDVPLESHSRVDFAPVDFIVDAFTRLMLAPRLAHDIYHVSTGEASMTLGQLANALTPQMPGISRVVMRGQGFVPQPEFARQRWMHAALEPYLPFLNADAVFSNARLQQALGEAAAAPQPETYLGELLQSFSLSDAVRQMYTP